MEGVGSLSTSCGKGIDGGMIDSFSIVTGNKAKAVRRDKLNWHSSRTTFGELLRFGECTTTYMATPRRPFADAP